MVERAVGGDQQAFTELVRSFDDQMRRLAAGLLGANRDAIDDVLQDAYISAYHGLAGFDERSAFATWLPTIVYRTCLNHLRSRSRRPEIAVADVDDYSVSDEGPDGRAAHDLLRSALAALPSNQAAVVLLVDAEGYSYREAAGVLGVREGTIASRLSRARRALERALATCEEDPS